MRGLAVLQLTDALIALHGDTAALDVTRNAQGRHADATRAGQGRADGELRWIRGALQPGSQLHWRVPLHDSTRTPATLLGELTAQLQVDQNMRVQVSMPEPADAGLTLDADLRVQGRQLPLHSMRSLWARIVLDDTRMQWRQPVGVDGRVRIQMRDLAFLMALYTRDRSIPNWMLQLVDAGQAQVTARVHWQGETVIVDRLQARNERF
ncbi:hypothetical protein BRN91_16435 [Xanthomonas oryzae pv. oryzae]|nr:hypothetical protein BRN91_16435 [Xanthomonas oryzae pv. oryzae]